ncbi:DUF5819 family protein [Streptantibioticus rubrisoli]|uniref:DUF5819 family protein n=1 Tax=Streptantibioticus rubrisoli TaxID=1387313 RepID=A0ABT1PA31_9ACTN|nr:DUF5819 family protein [Streptantibioticus rubrisoli]MCQ4042200.1 DUF5819 family protein [Streptantibioticus rubrisoli]
MEPPEDRAADEKAASSPPDTVGTPASGAAGTAPADTGGADGAAGTEEAADELGGISRLSVPSRIVVALAVAAVTVGAAVHLAMVFLHVAPTNTVSQKYARTIGDYVYPEFEQNWKLFAPNPLQENSDVQARAEVRKPDGTTATTGWVDLTAMDIARILHNPIPSHTEQNELRRAWSFYTDTHDDQNRSNGLRGDLAQSYVLRIVAHRFGPHLNGGDVQRIQVRSATTAVGAPPWSTEKIDTRTYYRTLPWWAVSPEDFA